MTFKAIRFYLGLAGIMVHYCNQAQITSPVTSATDTFRRVQIVRADFLREKKIDSLTTLQMLAGNVIVKEGTTTFTTDSAVINLKANTVDAFGRVHINESDSIHTYATYLKYVGNERKAYLRKNVTLRDKSGVLYTQELTYDMASGIGTYKNGGKIINKNTVLTSRDGTYLSDTKDVFFRNDVHLVDPKYDIRADSLQYNTLTEVVNFTGPTYIKSKDAEIFTKTGYYDLKKGKAYFGNRPLITDSAHRKYQADNVALDENTNTAQLEGNAVVIDSANGFTITGGQIFLNSKNNSFLATRKPVLIIQQENDSTYIAADTLFSGIRGKTVIIEDKSEKNNRILDSLKRLKLQASKIKAGNDTSVKKNNTDSLKNIHQPLDSVQRDSSKINSQQLNSTIAKRDSTLVTIWPKMTDSVRTDTLKIIKLPVNDTLRKPVVINASDTSVRYFLAFAHVRIFNDSLQAICDSLSYSGEDSVFRMYKNPVAWSGQNQLNGDTLYMFTKNKKADRLYVFENAMVINKSGEDLYNQISGRSINGYFIEGEIDYMRSKGSPAESVYYVQDKDSAYVGMNRASGSVIDMYFSKKELKKVLFINDVKGIMHPIRQIPEDQKFLRNFKWLDDKRPKNRLELFE